MGNIDKSRRPWEVTTAGKTNKPSSLLGAWNTPGNLATCSSDSKEALKILKKFMKEQVNIVKKCTVSLHF